MHVLKVKAIAVNLTLNHSKWIIIQKDFKEGGPKFAKWRFGILSQQVTQRWQQKVHFYFAKTHRNNGAYIFLFIHREVPEHRWNIKRKTYWWTDRTKDQNCLLPCINTTIERYICNNNLTTTVKPYIMAHSQQLQQSLKHGTPNQNTKLLKVFKNLIISLGHYRGERKFIKLIIRFKIC